jgi:hypothetical protein
MANLQIVISALNKASGDLNKVKQDITGVKDAGEKGGTAVEGFGDRLSGLIGKAALVTGAVVAVSAAMKEVYETAREGAELDYARDKFDALTDSIGTTSHALLVDLRDATSGLVSDAELVESAGQMMALGLAKTHDEAVRLATVAGELGMNMNQLVLTLTNQTTMRFDALGVSVAGFDEKVKALEESGLSANDAFTEAFLQQAEEQIGKVGSVADSAVGSFKLLEAGIKNIGDAAKANLLDTLEPALEGIAGYFSEQGTIAQADLAFENLVESMDAALIPSTALRQEFYKLTGPNGVLDLSKMDEFNALLEYYSGQVEIAKGGTQNWADANYDSAAGMAAAQAAAESGAPAIQSVADATNNADAAMRAYSESLLFKIASEGLSEEGALALARAMGLVDQNTVAATEQVNFYQDLLAAGVITQRQYNLLVADLADNIENLPEGKNLEVTTNSEEVLAVLAEIEMRKFKPKSLTVNVDLDTSAVDGYRPPTKYGTITYLPSQGMNQAVGGPVTAGQQYNWQEYGYRGEVFVPSADGFVLSRADAERALARALYSGESAIDPERIGKAVAKALSGITGNKQGGNVYNLTMPTSNNPADVRTAFELMEAWA